MRLSPKHLKDDSGIVIVMVLIIALALSMAATTFMVISNVETRALKCKTSAVRAELAATSGLERAIALVDNTYADATSDDPKYIYTPAGAYEIISSDLKQDKGWAGYFADTAETPAADSVDFVSQYDFDPYAGDDYGGGNNARPLISRRFSITQPDRFVNERTTGNYFVFIADMDGRLHINYKKWNLVDEDLRSIIYKHISDDAIDPLDPPEEEEEMDEILTHEWHSFGEFEVACDGKVEDVSTLTPYLTPYPANDAQYRLNINTARAKTIEAILKEVPNLDTALTAVVNKLVSARPFKDRQTMEAVIAELAPAPIGDDTFTEKQFNDLLNSLNGEDNPSNMSLFSKDADYTLGNPEVGKEYEFDFGATPPPPPPSNTGGDRTSDNDVTWGCEVVFNSRYYEILVLGRGWRLGVDLTAGRGRASERLLWAIYDAEGKKVIWRRWLFPADR